MAQFRVWRVTGYLFLFALFIGLTVYAVTQVVRSASSNLDTAHVTGTIVNVETPHGIRNSKSGQYDVTVQFVDKRDTTVTAHAIVENALLPEDQLLDMGAPIEVIYNKRFPSNIHFAGQERSTWNLYWPWVVGTVLAGGVLLGVARQTRRAYRPATESPVSED